MSDLLVQLETTFTGSPFYGTAVLEILENVAPKKALKQLQGRSMLRLARHMIAWRTFVLRKLQGDNDYDIEMNSEADWPSDDSIDWPSVLETLRSNQTQIVDAVKSFSETKLDERVPGRKYTFRYMLEGMVQHDIYHLGQIALLNKLVG